MAANPRPQARVAGLMDRRAERDALGGLVDAVRSGQSRALVVRGDPGVGKTVLVDHVAPVGLPRTRRACPRPEDRPLPVTDLVSRPSSYPCGQAGNDAP